MTLILLAALAMVWQDIFEVFKDQSQARNRAVLAGLFDTLMYLGLVASMTVSVTVLQAHNTSHKIEALVIISVANFIGQFTGVIIGARYIKND